MSDILQIFREVAAKQPDGIVTTTEVVDAIVAERGGSREYLTRKVLGVLRDLKAKGRVIPMKKRITTTTDTTTLVDAYKEKGAR